MIEDRAEPTNTMVASLKYGLTNALATRLRLADLPSARTIPVMRALAEDMRRLCPMRFWNCQSDGYGMLDTLDSGIQLVGLCHGVQTTMLLISDYLGPQMRLISHAAGIQPRVVYPIEHKKQDSIHGCANSRARSTIATKRYAERYFASRYFMTESTGHLSEYLPYFRKNEQDGHCCDEPDFGGETAHGQVVAHPGRQVQKRGYAGERTD